VLAGRVLAMALMEGKRSTKALDSFVARGVISYNPHFIHSFRYFLLLEYYAYANMSGGGGTASDRFHNLVTKVLFADVHSFVQAVKTINCTASNIHHRRRVSCNTPSSTVCCELSPVLLLLALSVDEPTLRRHKELLAIMREALVCFSSLCYRYDDMKEHFIPVMLRRPQILEKIRGKLVGYGDN
jgi:hypothetical protein